MFANPFWSLLIIAAPIALYFLVIRPRLKVNFTDTYLHIDSWWQRQWVRIYAFRTPVIATLGALAAAAPDLLVQVSSLDLSWLPQPWGAWTTSTSLIVVTVMKAFETKPNGQVV